MPKPIDALPGAANMAIPSDFQPDIQVTNRVVMWRGDVELHGFPGDVTQQVLCETGYPVREDNPERRHKLRREVFLLHEAARQGNANLLAYARKDRHPGRGKRPVSNPLVEQLTAPKEPDAKA